MVVGIFKRALRLRDRHIFVWQSLEILNIFNNISIMQIIKSSTGSIKCAANTSSTCNLCRIRLIMGGFP